MFPLRASGLRGKKSRLEQRLMILSKWLEEKGKEGKDQHGESVTGRLGNAAKMRVC